MDKTAHLNGCRTTKIYCLPGCPAGRRTKPENRVPFGSRKEARAAGYRACKICRPDGADSPANILFSEYYQSPLGTYVLASSERGIVCVKTEGQAPAFYAHWEDEKLELRGNGGWNRELRIQLDAYYAGKLRRFSVPLDLRGTPFQRQVWKLLCDIPYGETRSYGQIAEALGRPQAARAVGRAIGTNPVAIVVPCHRVVGSDGGLTGYGGGLERKRALLSLESTHPFPRKRSPNPPSILWSPPEISGFGGIPDHQQASDARLPKSRGARRTSKYAAATCPVKSAGPSRVARI